MSDNKHKCEGFIQTLNEKPDCYMISLKKLENGWWLTVGIDYEASNIKIDGQAVLMSLNIEFCPWCGVKLDE